MSNIKVAVRVRPLNKKEKDEGSKAIIQVKGDIVSIENVKLLGISDVADSRERIKHFMYDHCYDCMDTAATSATASQATVFQDLGTDVLQSAFDGFNACVFAYGQTGTGKTFTMMGQEEDVGLIPRICELPSLNQLKGPRQSKRFHDQSPRKNVASTRKYCTRILITSLTRIPRSYQGRQIAVLKKFKLDRMSILSVFCYQSLFSHVADCADDNVTCRIDISYYEIYNERVRDLLQPELLKQNEKYSLKVREHPKEGPYVKDLSWHRVKDNEEIQALLDTGNDYRVTAETYMHEHSSRSHAIVTICFTQARLEENRPSEIVSKVHLVDLAGSERADPSSKPGFRKRLTEGANINRSLVTLGYVIKALAEKSLLSWSTEDMGSIQNFQSSGGGESMATSSPSGPNKQRLPYIPYRDSVLTWLLKDSLGGNAKTIMIATITPASQYYNETISTLRYAQRAKNIINKPRINEDSNVALIRELRKEIERLHSMLAEAKSPTLLGDTLYLVPILRKTHENQSGNLLTLPDSEDSKIAERLHENEEMAKQLTQSWMCKWSSTHDIMKESDLSIRGLRNRTSSMGVMIDSQLPYLVAMDDDILSTGVCIFHLKEGETLIGREDADREQDIVLAGPHIEKEHCFIQNLEGIVTLVPSLGAMCAVQGMEVTEPYRLSQGDFLVLGGNQVFRFNNPTEAAKLREHRKSQGSLNNLSASRLSFGGLSRASSYSSIMSEDHSYLSPHSQYLKSSYPKRRHSDHIVYADADLCLDLERRYKTENERIEEARQELEKLREEHEKSEELRQEEEERMYQLHDQHRQEIEEQRHHLAKLIEENQRAREKAEEELELARESLAKEKEAFQKQLSEERERLKELHKQESFAVQTEPPQTSSIATDPELDVFSQGTQENLLKPKYSGGRKMSAEDQLQELDQLEFERKLSYRETEQSLSIQQEDLEDQYNSTQDQIEAKIEKIKQIQEQYKELDKTHLKEISAQKDKIESLRKKETELEVYIEEKEELMKVKTDLPRPLRNASSEMFLLSPELQDIKFPQKTTSLSDIQAGVEAVATGGEKILLSASSESLKSPVSPVSMETSFSQTMESSKPKGEHVKRKSDSEDKLSKISGVARDVTSRLYQPPEPKFRYVPKSKEKEVKTTPVRTRAPRERNLDAIGRGSPSRTVKDTSTRQSPSPLRSSGRAGKDNSSKFNRDSDKRHSPSPLRQSPSPMRHSPSSLRDIGRKTSPTPSKGKGKQTDSDSAKFKDRKTALNQQTENIPGRNKKESPVMAVRNKSPVKLDNASAMTDLKMRRSPDRLGVASNRLGGTSPLRQMASASSLASVPESLNEEDNGPYGMSGSSEPIVKKRTRRGRALLDDDEFRRHSAPDYEKLEHEFNAYSEKMVTFHPGEKESARISPTYRTSVSVDESELQNSQLHQENGRVQNDNDGKLENSEPLHTEEQVSEEHASKFYVSSSDEMTSEETENIKEPIESTIIEIPIETPLDLDDDKLPSDNVMVTSHVNMKSDPVLHGVKRDHADGQQSEPTSIATVKKLRSDKEEISCEMKQPKRTRSVTEGNVSFSDDSLDEEENNDLAEVNKRIVSTDILTQSLTDNVCFRKNHIKSLSDDSLENVEDKDDELMICIDPETKVSESVGSNVTAMDTDKSHTEEMPITHDAENLSALAEENDFTDIQESKETEFQVEDPETFVVTLDIIANTDSSIEPIRNKEQSVTLQDGISSVDKNDQQLNNLISENSVALETVNVVSSNLAKDMTDKHRFSSPIAEYEIAENLRAHEELEVHLGLEGEIPLTHEELKVKLKLEGESCVLGTEKKNSLSTEPKDNENGLSKGIEVIPVAKDSSTDVEMTENLHDSSSQGIEPMEIDHKLDTFTNAEDEIHTTSLAASINSEQKQILAEALLENKSNLEAESAVTAEINTNNEIIEAKKSDEMDVDNSERADTSANESSTAIAMSDQDSISATEILPHTRTIAVWTSLEYIADLDVSEETIGGHGSDDSLLDPHKELKVLQEALEQLPSKSSSKDGPQLSTARRAARQRAMIRNELRTTDSDGVSAQSDESPASGNFPKSSSRPGSGSRRRRRPNGRGLAQAVSEHTTDEYASSDSDSLFSDDSLRSGDQGSLIQNGDVERSNTDKIRPANLEIRELETTEMLPQQLRGGPQRQGLRLDRQSSGVEINSFDGGRSVGIQTSVRSDRIHSGGSTRTDMSDEFDVSFASGDYSRNMAVSPLSLWSNNDRKDSDSCSDKNSSSSAGIRVSLGDLDRSMTPTPRSSARSSTSVFSFKSNLEKGPTETWSSSASDLRRLAGFNEDLEYVIETEGMYPGQAALNCSDDVQSQRSFKIRTPVEGEKVTPRPVCSTPNNAKTAQKIIHVTFPEGHSLESEAYSIHAPVKYQVTIHEDNTNILYNVDKTEYKTYSLRNQGDIEPAVIPDTIHVNLTETVTSKTHEKFDSNAKEAVSFQKPDDQQESGDESLILERSFRSSCSSERELSVENGAIPREIVKEITEKNEQQTFHMPLKNVDLIEKVTKKKLELQQSGIIASINYPADVTDIKCGESEYQALSGDINPEESDTTSDYGTFTSCDGRKGLMCFTSDSEGEAETLSPCISPRASHISTQHIKPMVKESLNQLPEQSTTLETSEENIQPLLVEGQNLCSVQQVFNQPVIAARVLSSSPTQLVQTHPNSFNNSELNVNESQLELPNPMQVSDNAIANASPMKSNTFEIESDTSSTCTLEMKTTNKADSEMSSRETLESIDTIKYDSDDNRTNKENINHENNADLQYQQENSKQSACMSSPTPDELVSGQKLSNQSPNLSPRPSKRHGSSLSSADEVYLSLEKLETSTSSSDYQTPQQSPRTVKEEIVPALVSNVEIPDIDSDRSSLSPTPREGMIIRANIDQGQETECPKREKVMTLRTVSVNTEAVSLVSNSPAITKQTFFDENDPAYTEQIRKELKKKIATLKHTERSLSDSAISSDFTDCDSSPRGSRFYDHGKFFGGSHLRDRLQGVYNAAQSPNHDIVHVNFDAPSVKKSLFADSGNVYDHEDHEDQEQGSQNSNKGIKDKTGNSVDSSANHTSTGAVNQTQSKCRVALENDIFASDKPLTLQLIPTADAVEKFPESITDSVLAIKPFPYTRSISLDGLSTLVNVDTHLSRAVRHIPSEEPGITDNQVSMSERPKCGRLAKISNAGDTEENDMTSNKQFLIVDTSTQQLDHNQNLLNANSTGIQPHSVANRYLLTDGQPMSQEQLLIRPEPEYQAENRRSLDYENNSRIKGKSPSLPDLEPTPIKQVHRSLSETNIDDFEENDSSSSSSDSITFVFVDKNDKGMEHVVNIEHSDICMQEADDDKQEYSQNYLYQNDYNACDEYSGSESQSPDSKLYSGSESQSPDSKLYSGSESQSPDIKIYLGRESQSPDSRPYSVTESQSPDSRPISGLAPSGTESEDYLYDMNTGEKIVYRDGFPGGLQSEEVLGRTNSRHSNSCADILDESSSHSGSEEIEEIVKNNGEAIKMGDSREISGRLENMSPPTYTEHSDEQTQSDGLDQNPRNSRSVDDKPLRHKFGIDESVLPMPERAVSADNLPKHKLRFKDIQRSRSADMVEVGGSNEQESEEGIFPPAIINADEDQTDPSISLRTMSETGIDHVSQRTVSELGMTYSSRTSSELDSVTSTSDSLVAKVKALHSADSTSENSDSEEEFQEEIIIEYAKAYHTEKMPNYESGITPTVQDKDDFRKSSPTPSEGEVDPAVLQDDEHIREVLRTVEKFIMPKQVLVDHGTSTDDEKCSLFVSVGVQTSAVDASTQTLESNPIHVNPDQILLPALAAPFRAQSMDSFGLGTNMPRLVLSEGSDNWCTLGQLMVETTDLLRRINERLPDIENRNSLASSEESKAILKKWQEISIQTGYSLADLSSVGLQTDDDLLSLSDVWFDKGINSKTSVESTQTDKQFKMKPLEVSETVMSELIPAATEMISCEISVQTDPGSSAVSVQEAVQMSLQLDNVDTTSEKESGQQKLVSAESDTTIHIRQDTGLDQQTSPRQSCALENTVLPPDEIKAGEKTEPNVSESRPVTSNGTLKPHTTTINHETPKADGIDSLSKNQSLPQQHVIDAPVYRSRQMSNPLKQKVSLPLQSAENQPADENSTTTANPAVLSANLSEIEALRKEHAKLIENLRNASASRTERQDKIKARKHAPEYTCKYEELNAEAPVPKPLPTGSANKVQSNKQPVDGEEASVHRPPTPQEFVKVNIQVDPKSGVDVENTTFESKVAAVKVHKKRNILHEQTWQLTGDGILTISEEKPDLTSDHSRTESNTSLSSDGTSESELATVTAGLDNMADPVEYAAARAGALNPLFKNKDDVIDDVLGNDIIKPEKREMVHIEPVTEKMIKTLIVKPEKIYGDSAEMYPEPEKLETAFVNKAPQNYIKNKNENMQENETQLFLPEEETIVPKIYKKDHALPSHIPTKVQDTVKQHDRSVSPVLESSLYERQRMVAQEEEFFKSETCPRFKASELQFPPDKADKLMANKTQQSIPASKSHSLTTTASPITVQPLTVSCAFSPDKKSAPKFGHLDDSTQVSLEFSDDFTQTDPDTSVETVIHVQPVKNKEDRKENEIVPSKSNAVSSGPVRARPEVSNTMTRELERLQNERGEIMELLALNYLPTSLTVELLEAKLNYCIGQTDLLLGSLDDNFKPDVKPKTTAIDQQFAREYIAKYRSDLKKSKQDIQMCRETLQKGGVGAGRGRTPQRNRDLFHARRLAQIEAFRLERMREQQDYERSRCSTPIKGNTPLRGNTPLKGNSPIATPRSNISRDSSPDYSPAYMTPKEHKNHFSDLRKQLIRNVLEEERQHTRSCSPTLLGHHPDSRNLDGSFGFSPKINVSASSGLDKEDVCTYTVAPGTYPDSPRTSSVDRYPHLSAAYYQHPNHNRPHHELDTRMTAESIFSPQESEQILREIQEIQKRTKMATPKDETSSFSPTHSHSGGSGRGALSPRGHSGIPGPRHRSQSPVSGHPDESLSLNLDSLHDSRLSDLEDTRPYSPYSAYAREHILPNERSHDGGVLRGSYELYDSTSHDRSHNRSHDGSHDSDYYRNSPRSSGLSEQRLGRLRPVRSDDVKARLGRHKR